jgi:tRNA dimethylallyltransferase
MLDGLSLTSVLYALSDPGDTDGLHALAARDRLTSQRHRRRYSSVYRRLDIGTAKPSPGVQAALPHYGIDVIEPGERYTAGRFAHDAAVWLEQVRAAGREPLVVGGTGFYVRALADGLFRAAALVRCGASRCAWTARLPAAQVAHWAASRPRIHGGGRQRGARAISGARPGGARALLSGSAGARDRHIAPVVHSPTIPCRDVLRRRIAARVDRMLAAGLVARCEGLLGVGSRRAGPRQGKYREVIACCGARCRRRPAGMRSSSPAALRQAAGDVV